MQRASAELSYTKVGEKGISFAKADSLGRGGYGYVFPGIFKDCKVAVKRIQLLDCVGKCEIELQINLNHENVLKILEVDQDDDFRYIVLELCAGTLKDFIKKKYTGPMPTDREVLYQIACGVQYLHSKKLIHRDIKPDNILISCTVPVVIKVSDFGLSKQTSSGGTFTWSEIKGTPNWIAPEILRLLYSNPDKWVNVHGSVQSDVFALGCVFFYFIERGTHPFGDIEESRYIEENIRNGKPVNLIAKLPSKHFAYGLIEKMIKIEEERTDLTQVMETLEKQLYQFKAIERSLPQISGLCWSRFHPTDPVLACLSESTTVILLKAENGSIPFSDWRIQQELQRRTQFWIHALEWNVNGTQLAAGCADGTVVVWSYPSGRVIFEIKKHWPWVELIAWNPFRQDVLATLDWEDWKELLFWDTRENGDAKMANHFLTLKRQVPILSVAWISANQIAIGLWNGDIEIYEIDGNNGTSRVVKQFTHSSVNWGLLMKYWAINGLQWNERTKHLASCSWNDEWIKIWSMDIPQSVQSLKVPSPCRRLAWRRNLNRENDGGIEVERSDKENFRIACGLEDGSVAICNPLEEDEANKKRILPHKYSRPFRSLSFSPDGRFLASVDGGGELIIWSTETWLPLFTCKSDGWRLSWMSTDSSTSFPANKLAVTSDKKILVIEQFME